MCSSYNCQALAWTYSHVTAQGEMEVGDARGLRVYICVVG